MSVFRAAHPVRFAHCDSAGIAYYPRLFELCDAVIEDWWAQALAVPRTVSHLEMGLAIPTVTMDADYVAPCRMGETIDFALTLTELGRTSMNLAIEASCGGERRFGVRYRQVLMDKASGRAVPWPDDWRARLAATMETAA